MQLNSSDILICDAAMMVHLTLAQIKFKIMFKIFYQIVKYLFVHKTTYDGAKYKTRINITNLFFF